MLSYQTIIIAVLYRICITINQSPEHTYFSSPDILLEIYLSLCDDLIISLTIRPNQHETIIWGKILHSLFKLTIPIILSGVHVTEKKLKTHFNFFLIVCYCKQMLYISYTMIYSGQTWSLWCSYLYEWLIKNL